MSSVAKSRVCTKCGKRKPVTEYYVKVKRTGRRLARCRTCHNAITQANYFANHERNKEKVRNAARAKYAADPVAGRAKKNAWRLRNLDKLHRQARERYDPQRRRAERLRYREQIRRQAAEYRERNRERLRQAAAEYRTKYREETLARTKAWQKANPERLKANNQRYKHNNPARRRADAHRRYAKQKGNGGSFSGRDWLRLKTACGNRCLACGEPEAVKPLCVDHVVPIRHGGTSFIWNLQPLCKSCNSVKHTRTVDLRPIRIRAVFRA